MPKLARLSAVGLAFESSVTVIFNLANILLVAAIDIAGLAVAFPVGIGLALILGVITTYLAKPEGSVPMLALGVGCVMMAIVLDALAYKRLAATDRGTPAKLYVIGLGVLIASNRLAVQTFGLPLCYKELVSAGAVRVRPDGRLKALQRDYIPHEHTDIARAPENPATPHDRRPRHRGCADRRQLVRWNPGLRIPEHGSRVFDCGCHFSN
jgi:hypothetical protein